MARDLNSYLAQSIFKMGKLRLWEGRWRDVSRATCLLVGAPSLVHPQPLELVLRRMDLWLF